MVNLLFHQTRKAGTHKLGALLKLNQSRFKKPILTRVLGLLPHRTNLLISLLARQKYYKDISKMPLIRGKVVPMLNLPHILEMLIRI